MISLLWLGIDVLKVLGSVRTLHVSKSKASDRYSEPAWLAHFQFGSRGSQAGSEHLSEALDLAKNIFHQLILLKEHVGSTPSTPLK